MPKLKNLTSEEIDDFLLDDPILDEGLKEPKSYNDFSQTTSLENESATDIIPRCEFLTGGAGTGKTYEIKRRIQSYREEFPNRDRQYGILAATTGIAAINLGDGATTVNSVLMFFDTSSLEDGFNSGKLQKALKDVSRVADNLIVDEISMMHGRQLDIIWDALVEINQHEETKERGGLGIILTGDFCQLPPVPDKDHLGKNKDVKYAFEAICWSNFEKHTTKLTKNWRQDDLKFVEALEAARKGDGAKCASLLANHSGVRFCEEIQTNFDGTTIFSKNVEVDRLNQTRLRNLLHQGRKAYSVKSFRWGKQRAEWKNIPEQLDLCESCYVMILNNDSKSSGFRYANGSTGYVEGFTPPIEEKRKEEVKVEEKKDDDFDLVIDVDEDDIQKKGGEEIYYSTPNTFSIRLKDKKLVHSPFAILDEFPVGQSQMVDVKVEIGKISRQCSQKEHPDGQTRKPEYDSFSDWKEGNSTLFKTAKQAKVMYDSYLKKLTNDNKNYHNDFQDTLGGGGVICKCGIRFLALALWEEHQKKAPPEVYFDYLEGRWIVGEIYYFPLRIAYASTCHKSQGLTLDRVQIDFINQFFGSPSMAYVALSRCKTAEGMRLVGSPRLLAERVNVSRKVLRFI